MAKITKTTKKVSAPVVAEEEVTPEVEETIEEVAEIKEEVIKTRKNSGIDVN